MPKIAGVPTLSVPLWSKPSISFSTACDLVAVVLLGRRVVGGPVVAGPAVGASLLISGREQVLDARCPTGR